MHFRETSSCPDQDDVTPPPMIDLYVETLAGTAFEVRVSPFETILSVKSKIQRMEGIPASQQHLIWRSKELVDENSLHDYCIVDGSTLKLVLAMRGGPINTRRVPIEDPAWREMMEYVEANRDEIWEKLPGGRQVTLLVFRDGDQINFFRVIDRGDGTLSPLAETLSGSPSMRAMNEEETEEEIAARERVIENAITLQKMHALRTKMDMLSLRKKPRKVRSHSHRPTSRSSGGHYHVLAVKPKIHGGGSYSLNKHTRLPPVASIAQTSLLSDSQSSSTTSLDELLTESGAARSSLNISTKDIFDKRTTMASLGNSSELSKRRHQSIPGMSYSTLEAFRRTMVKLKPEVQASTNGDDAAEIGRSDSLVRAAITTAAASAGTAGAKPKSVLLPRVNRATNGPSSSKRKVLYAAASGRQRLDSLMDPAEMQHALAKIDSRISSFGRHSSGSGGGSSSSSGGSGGHRGRHRDHRLLGGSSGSNSSVGIPSRFQLHHPVDAKMLERLRPKTSPEKLWMGERSLSTDVSGLRSASTSKDMCCDLLNRTAAPRMRLMSSRGSAVVAATSTVTSENGRKGGVEERRRLRSIDDPLVEEFGSDDAELLASGGRECRRRNLDLVSSLLSEDNDGSGPSRDMRRKFSLEENKAVAQEISLKATQLLLRLSPNRTSNKLSSSAQKLPPLKSDNVPKKLEPIIPARCEVCRKKIGLVTTYTCRCGRNFCASHRYAETHECTFDYKTEGRRLLERANPLVAAPKLPKI